MTDSLDEILSANQKLYVLNQKLTEEVKRLRAALVKLQNSVGCYCGEIRQITTPKHSEKCTQALIALKETK